MIRERTTESPSAKPWDCCYVSEGSNFRRAPHFCLECDCVAQLIHTRFCCSHPGHILEHSEDDTKSLFAIIKVHRPPLRHSFFYSCPGCYYSVGPLQKKKKKKVSRRPFFVSVCVTTDHQWPHVFPRNSQEGVRIALEELHSRQEVHGKQGGFKN